MKVLILGGTGNISRQIVQVLFEKGDEVTVYNRGQRKDSLPEGIKRIYGDRFDRKTFESQMKKEKFDAVIDMICFDPEDIASTLRVFGNQCSQIIFTSSIACLKRPFNVLPPFKEDGEYCDDPAHAYGYKKAFMEKEIFKLASEYKGLSWTIVRPGLTFGQGGTNFGVFRQNYGLVKRMREGKPVIIFGDGQCPVSITFTPDLARGYAAILGNPKAAGQVYHINSMEYTTWDMLYRTLGRIIGVSPEIVHIPTDLLYAISPAINGHIFFEKQYVGLFDASKAMRDLGFNSMFTVESGLRWLIEGWENGEDTDIKEKIDEDKVVTSYLKWKEEIIREMK